MNRATDDAIRDLAQAASDAVPYNAPTDILEQAAARASRRRGQRTIGVAVAGVAVLVLAAAALVARDDGGANLTASGRPSTSEAGLGPEVDGFAAPLEARLGVATVVVDGDIFVWGGSREASNMGIAVDGPDRMAFSDGAIFNVASTTWRHVPPAPVSTDVAEVGAYPSTAALLGDGVVVGRGTDAAYLDPRLGEWERLPEVASPIFAFAAVADGVLAIGPNVLLTAEHTWEPVAKLPGTIDAVFGAAIASSETSVLVVPLANAQAAPAVALEYDVASREWATLAEAPIKLNQAAVTWDGERFVAVNASGETASVDESGTWAKLGTLGPGPAGEISVLLLASDGDATFAAVPSSSGFLRGGDWADVEEPPRTAISVVVVQGSAYGVFFEDGSNTARPVRM